MPATYGALRVSSARGRCCAGIGRSCAGSGGRRPASADARLRRPRCGPWCCGWLARIRGGAIVGSAVSWPNSATNVANDDTSAARPRGPAPGRPGPGWRAFLRAQAASIVACGHRTVESVLLRRYYVFFFIAHASRRVRFAGCSPNPTGAWMTQQARSARPQL